MKKSIHKKYPGYAILCGTKWDFLFAWQMAKYWKHVTCKKCLKLK